MQKKKFIITLLFAVLSIFMITACNDSSNESNNSGNNGGGGTVQPEPEPDNLTVKKFYNFDAYYSFSTYAILSDGSLYTWGDNNYGQLGLGDNANIYYTASNNQKINIPDKLNELIGLKDVKYDASKSTTISKFSLYAITENGELYAWGDNSDGQLGIGNTDNQTKPVKVTGITGKIKQIITFKHYGEAFFDYFSVYALTEDGSLYAWGNNSNGPLGLGNTDNQTKPVKVTAITGKIKELIVPESSSPYSIIIAITEDNSLYTWGDNRDGQLGVGDDLDRNTPTKVNLPGMVKEIMHNSYSVYTILEDGSLYAWGNNSDGQLGVGDEVNRNIPAKVNLSGKVKLITTKGESVYALTEDGSLYAWGYNFSGELGAGNVNEYVNTPAKVNLPAKIKELIINYSSYYAILEDGSLYAWGNNSSGQLGVGDEVNRNTPTKVNLPSKVKLITTKYDSVYAILEDSSLYTWGDNGNGELGAGNVNEYVNTPAKVNLPANIKELIISYPSAYAILEDGSLYVWGANYDAQLGVGDKVNRNNPAKVNLSGTIKELRNYLSSVYALMEDNSLYAWGDNGNGVLGVGKNDDSIYIPEQVTGINGAIKDISYLSHNASNSDVEVHFLTENGLLYGTGLHYSAHPEKIAFKEQ